MKNCFTPEERKEVDICFKTKADDLLRDVCVIVFKWLAHVGTKRLISPLLCFMPLR